MKSKLPHALALLASLPLLAAAEAPLSVGGSLVKADDAFPSGIRIDTLEAVPIKAGQFVRVEVEADFDSVLIVDSPVGMRWENDDRPNGGAEDGSIVTFEAPHDGDYLVRVRSYEDGELGDYTVEIARSEAELVMERRGKLKEGDSIGIKGGEFYDTYPVELEEGARLVVDMQSADFDAFLAIHLPDGTVINNDDGTEGNTDSSLDIVSKEAGVATLVATSFDGASTGDYQLQVRKIQGE